MLKLQNVRLEQRCMSVSAQDMIDRSSRHNLRQPNTAAKSLYLAVRADDRQLSSSTEICPPSAKIKIIIHCYEYIDSRFGCDNNLQFDYTLKDFISRHAFPTPVRPAFGLIPRGRLRMLPRRWRFFLLLLWKYSSSPAYGVQRFERWSPALQSERVQRCLRWPPEEQSKGSGIPTVVRYDVWFGAPNR